MREKALLLCGVLLCLLTAGVDGQETTAFTGKVTSATSQVVGGQFAMVLRLGEYPDHAFYISLADAPKFGLTKDTEIRSGDDFGQFVKAMEALQGQRVKLAAVKLTGPGASDYQVKALERLTGK